MKVVSGHQPVYLPWLGLIHKASLADTFVFMDDVQYLQQDWNNRNRVKTPQGKALWLTVPVDLKRSPSMLLKDILVSEARAGGKQDWQAEHWNTLRFAYGKASCFKTYSPFFEWFYLERRWERLAELNLALLRQVFEWFGIDAELIVASEARFAGKKSDLVLEHGLRFGADLVVTGALGRDYIREEDFRARGIRVVYQDYRHPVYEQRFGDFISHLSFVDLLFNHGPASREICLRDNLRKEDLCALTSP